MIFSEPGFTSRTIQATQDFLNSAGDIDKREAAAQHNSQAGNGHHCLDGEAHHHQAGCGQGHCYHAGENEQLCSSPM